MTSHSTTSVGPYVRGGVVRLPVQYLGGRPLRGTAESHRVLHAEAREPEVCDFDAEVGVDEQVGRLEVAVQNRRGEGVEVEHTLSSLQRHLDAVGGSERERLVLQYLCEGAALEELHDDEHLAVAAGRDRVADPEQLDDVWVVQLGEDRRLVAEL
eukprot:CAMPEP_0196756810 /NCGR_PEP_ID=MMETSP1091-20130531/102279_1 /TAXON_ID=302021 /ORGANISM="Rhodomonas sp., Strain CCMP768" /LENGTH=154 /DNA_ID=CAMNT_0042105491 /DNA_START=58 /DNA_END=517 /DNA_ORIENTATION=-